ncbi:MAG: SMI1/KNR4 family protein [Clostridium sp.]
MSVIWKMPYEISDEELQYKITNFEEKYMIKFPSLYKDILEKKRARCLACEIMIKGFDSQYSREAIYWCTFDGETMDLYMTNDRNSDVIPKGIVFFAYTSGGNYYAFDYSNNENSPQIVFYNHNYVPPKDELKEESNNLESVDIKQRKCYKIVYDNFEDLYNYLEIGQKYWIEEEFGSQESDEFIKYYNRNKCIE